MSCHVRVSCVTRSCSLVCERMTAVVRHYIKEHGRWQEYGDGRLSAVCGQTSPVSAKVSRCIHGSTFPPYFLSPLKLAPS